MKYLGFILVLSLGWITSFYGQNKRPNILLIISDQHTAKVMTQTGYEHVKTPGIDKLADAGVTFTRNYCTYPVCVAFRASLITGMMPSKSHSNKNLTNYTSIGTVMKNADYETAYFGKWHVSNSKIDKVADWHGFETYEREYNDSKTEDLTLNFLSEKHDKPFFLITSFLNPHDCCELARNISGLGDSYHDGPVEEHMEVDECPPLPDNFNIPPNEPEGVYCRRTPDTTDMTNFRKHPVKYWGETEWRQYMYGYDRLVEKMDAHILNIVKSLEKQGQLDNTIIFYTSDHGDGHASHQWNQKMSFYEEAVNTPFIVSWKGHTKAGLIDSKTLTSSGLDLFPTICKLAGAEDPSSLQGNDISPYVLKGFKPSQEKRDYIVSEINQTSKTENGKVVFVGRMVVSENYKYVLFDGGENREQLFDLTKDPGEMEPVTYSARYKKELMAHRAMLKDWIIKTADPFSIEDIPN
jgi:arylsulfatase A-like enzyme